MRLKTTAVSICGIDLLTYSVSLSGTAVSISGIRVSLGRKNQLTSHVEILEQDINEVIQQFDIVTFRAFLPLEKVMDQLSRILKPGGTIGAYKGRRELLEEELAPLSANWESEIIELKVPFLESERTFCLLRRRGE